MALAMTTAVVFVALDLEMHVFDVSFDVVFVGKNFCTPGDATSTKGYSKILTLP